MVENLGPRPGNGVVCLINDDQARLPVGGGEPADERLHGCDLDCCICTLNASGDDAVLDAGGCEFAAGLMDQLTAMHKDQHLAAAGCGVGGDGRQDDGLACAGGCNQ
jgi:hypothetical protein